MADFVADIRDIKFTLFEQLDIDKLTATERYGAFGRQDMELILDEAYKLAREAMAPISAAVDREGCTIKDGKVTVPQVMHEPYRLFVEGGWQALNHSPEFGGQGAPDCLMLACCDLFIGANLTFNLGALLTTGAAHLVEAFGSEELKRTFVEKMYTGKWAGTMCLTEAQAGSDVGAVKTKAVKEGDHYLIEGEKIFITFGDHDLTENVVHAVLARVEGAPKGTAGISLFVVPKYRVAPDGSVGEPNDVVCSGIEHKLGIHGSPTCTLVFGQDGKCHGYLLGEENKGMRAMFQMMNEARISVGLQGAALGNAAYQAALAFAKERVQGTDIRQFRDPNAPRVPIIRHPDVRMMLMRQKAYGEGMRALLYFAAYCGDRARADASQSARERYEGLLEIMTPVCKAYCSDMGFRVTEWALQTFGGYGYCKEYPAEQYLRDCKIASIYEGTNGIQALDLVGRKMGMKNGAYVFALIAQIGSWVEATRSHAALAPLSSALGAARDAWTKVNGYFMEAAMTKKLLVPLVNASTYLSLTGDVLLAGLLLDQARIAWDKLVPLCQKAGVDPADGKAVSELAKQDPEVRYLDAKVKTARYFCLYELPLVQAKAAAIQSGDMSALYVRWEDEVD
ncbi:MAG: acyl-CoA dehydrogenase [Deltaproteobacteria bacterium]|nr:acyl-CoA dehydrogenase [Deltaproteobacteria bacterium]